MAKKAKKSDSIEQKYDWVTTKNGADVEFIMENVRIAFSGNGKFFFEPEDKFGKLNYKADFILEDEDVVEQVKEVVQYLVRHHVDDEFEFDDDFDGSIDGVKNLFFKIGDDNTNKEGTIYDGFKGKFYVKGKKPGDQEAPDVFDNSGEHLKEYSKDKVLADGSYANVAVRAYWMEKWETLGLSIDAVQYTEEGESFSADSSFATNDDKRQKLLGKFKPKKSKEKMAFGGKKKKKKSNSED